jgi:hypothetical protein
LAVCGCGKCFAILWGGIVMSLITKTMRDRNLYFTMLRRSKTFVENSKQNFPLCFGEAKPLYK